jgi:hypothetical protein
MNIHPGEESKTIDEFPRIYRFFESDSVASGREKRLEKDLKVLQNKH